MIAFKAEMQKPVLLRYVTHVGGTMILVEPQPDGRIWQYMLHSYGEFSDATAEDCCEDWPHGVVGRLRRAADELEALLREDQEHETDLEGRAV